MTEAAPPNSLAERLRNSHVGLRPDLQVVRHRFRGEPAYVIRDPMTMQSHRFDLADYEILVHLDASRSLGETFERLIAEGLLGADQEERFYSFVVDLHQLAFLNLPVSNAKTLYKRFQHKRSAERAARIKGFLFLRIPLWNPDAFLDRTAHLVRPIFGRIGFAVWLAVMLAAGILLARNWSTFIAPSHGVLAAGNLPWMWVLLIGLKVVHEFGHAYACKVRGGAVPEMGAFMVVFTPLAYVDATASWGFPRRLDRMVVSLAGVYVETFLAALALLIWAFTTSPFVATLAHNVVLLGGLVTVVMNVNPLMRFDGYYVLSDLVEVPNLRSRAESCVRDRLKHWFLGVPLPEDGGSRRMRLFLFTFGAAASVYKVVIVISLSMLLARKAFLVGMGVAVAFVGSQLIQTTRSLIDYLWRSEETAPLRRRAIAVGLLLLIGLPAFSAAVPVPSAVRAPGVVAREHERVLRAPHDAFVESVETVPGRTVEEGAPIATLRSASLREALLEARSRLSVAQLETRAGLRQDAAAAARNAEREAVGRAEVALRQRQHDGLALTAPMAGRVVQGLDGRDVGRFVLRGDPVATVATGGWRIRSLLTADEIARVHPEPGATVSLRVPSEPAQRIHGRVVRVSPHGSREVALPALTHRGGGPIPVADAEDVADQPYFEVLVAVEGEARALREGLRAQVRFGASAEPLATGVVRRVLRLANRFGQD